MTTPHIATGMSLAPIPTVGRLRARVLFARLSGLESLLLPDHLQMWIPSAIWDPDFSWVAKGPGTSIHRF